MYTSPHCEIKESFAYSFDPNRTNRLFYFLFSGYGVRMQYCTLHTCTCTNCMCILYVRSVLFPKTGNSHGMSIFFPVEECQKRKWDFFFFISWSWKNRTEHAPPFSHNFVSQQNHQQEMNCISRHHPLHAPMFSMHNNSISDCDTMAPMPKYKLLSHKTMNSLLPDLQVLNSNFSAQMDPASAKKLTKSFADLEFLVREAQMQTSCGVSLSMSKLDQPIKVAGVRAGAGIPPINSLAHNAVFTMHDVRGAPKANLALRKRRPKFSIRKLVADSQRKQELKLDGMRSLRCMMEDFRKQNKSGKRNFDFDCDFDDEDLDV